ncbi:hypothetical protein BJ875DRAFT_466119, partial [Amylocarpus encephaloides]
CISSHDLAAIYRCGYVTTPVLSLLLLSLSLSSLPSLASLLLIASAIGTRYTRHLTPLQYKYPLLDPHIPRILTSGM